MAILREFFQRKAIDAQAAALVAEHFTPLVLKKMTDTNQKKANRKTQNVVSQFKQAAQKHMDQAGFGVYGKARFLRATQNRLLETGVEESLTILIIKSLV